MGALLNDEPLLSVHQIGKRLSDVMILKGISFDLGPRAGLSIIGPNGAGKTTLLRIIAGITKPTMGSIQRFGMHLGSDATSSDRRLSYLGHKTFLYPELSGFENLVFYAQLYGLDRPKQRAEQALQAVELGWSGREVIRTYSRGMMQRVAIARAFLNQPRLLLLDEPYTGLDMQGAGILDRFLLEHKHRGGSLVMITHQIDEALRHADALAILQRGQFVWWGPRSMWDADTLSEHYQRFLATGGRAHS